MLNYSGHAPLINGAHSLPRRLQIMFFVVFCSVDGWQTTILEGLGHLWHILFTNCSDNNQCSDNTKEVRNPSVFAFWLILP